MESFILIVVGVFALHYLSQKQDRMADAMIGQEFNRFERIYHNITYSCHDATVVRKQLNSAVSIPLIPSTRYNARALCLTGDGHWFWFDAKIRQMKLHNTSITPTTAEEALNALKDDPESIERYFSKSDQQSV